jgi:hypothetical protein
LSIEALLVGLVSLILGDNTILGAIAPESISRMRIVARLTATMIHSNTLAALLFITLLTLQILTLLFFA